MVNDLLAGKADLRTALLAPRHTEVLNDAVGQFRQWRRDLTPEQRTEQERLTRDYAKNARREAAADARPVRHCSQPADDDAEIRCPILRKRRR